MITTGEDAEDALAVCEVLVGYELDPLVPDKKKWPFIDMILRRPQV